MQMQLFIDNALNLCTIIPAAILCYLPMTGCLRYPPKWIAAVAGIVLTVLILGYAALQLYAQAPPNALLIPMFPLFFLLYLRTLTISWDKALFAFFTSTSITAIGCMLSVLIAGPMEETARQANVVTASTSLLGVGLCLASIPLCMRLMRRKINWLLCEFHASRAWRGLWLLPALYTALLVYCMPQGYSILLYGRVRSISILIVCLSLVMVMSFLDLFYRLAKGLAEKNRVEQENLLLQLQHDRLEQLNEHIQETRAIRHDFRQHLRVISELAKTERYAEMKAYLQRYEGTLPSEHTTLCANAAMDAIAAYYDSIALRHGIAISWRLELPARLPIPDVDLCTLLGNLMENAIHAAMLAAEDSRSVNAVIRMLSEGMVGVSIANTCAPGAARQKNQPTGEGIGLKSVAAVVKRYHGTMDIHAGEHEHHVRLLLNVPLESNGTGNPLK